MSCYSTNRQLGLHLTNHHLRLVEFDGKKTVGIFGWRDLAVPLTELKKQHDLSPLQDDFAAVIKEAVPRRPVVREAVLTIGDEEIFTKMIEMPRASRHDAATMAPHEIEPELPIKAEELYADAIILEDRPADKKMDVMVYAAPRKVIDGLLEAADSAGINLIAIEAASVSLARLYGSRQQCFITIDVGTEHSSITVVDREQIRVSTSASYRSSSWVEVLKKHPKNLTREQAVTLYGSIVTGIAEKTQTAIRYYANRSQPVCAMQQVLLSGNGATAPHLTSMLTSLLDIPTVVGTAPVSMSKRGDASYLAAVGAALRSYVDN